MSVYLNISIFVYIFYNFFQSDIEKRHLIKKIISVSKI